MVADSLPSDVQHEKSSTIHSQNTQGSGSRDRGAGALAELATESNALALPKSVVVMLVV